MDGGERVREEREERSKEERRSLLTAPLKLLVVKSVIKSAVKWVVKSVVQRNAALCFLRRPD